MRGLILSLTACATLTLSGCSQISGWLHGGENSKSHYHTQSGGVEQTIRATPDQTYQFSDSSYDVELYDGASSQTTYSTADTYSNAHMGYDGYDVVLYNNGVSRTQNYTPVDPREAAFVMLNGASSNTDWRTCETRARGYLYMSEYDFTLDPEFEVCMRNKGYVLETEASHYALNPISAKTAGLRSYSPTTIYQGAYSSTAYIQPTHTQSSSVDQTSYNYP